MLAPRYDRPVDAQFPENPKLERVLDDIYTLISTLRDSLAAASGTTTTVTETVAGVGEMDDSLTGVLWVEDGVIQSDAAHSQLEDIGTDDHHAQVHALDGADHSTSGLSGVLRVTTGGVDGDASHSELEGIGANDHHNQQHDLTGSDHTDSGLTPGDVLTATGADTFAWSAPPATGADTDLGNLADVAINAALVPDSDNDTDLGSGTYSWRDLYLKGIITDGMYDMSVASYAGHAHASGLSKVWTTQADWEDGTLDNVDTATTPDSLQLDNLLAGMTQPAAASTLTGSLISNIKLAVLTTTGSGTTLKDYHDGKDATITGAASSWQTGPNGGYVYRFGTTTVGTGADTNLPSGNSARTILVRMKSSTPADSYDNLFSYGTAAAGKKIWLCRNGSDGLTLSVYGTNIDTTGVSLGDGNWHTIIVTSDGGTPATWTIYVDGTSRGSGTATTDTTLTGSYLIGYDAGLGGTVVDLDLEEVVVWSTALTSSVASLVSAYYQMWVDPAWTITGTDTLDYDAGAEATYGTCAWAGTVPANTTVKMRVKTAATQAGLAAASWSSYVTSSGSSVTVDPGRWSRTEVWLQTTDGYSTPVLTDSTLTYTLTGQGGQVAHANLANAGTLTHAQIDGYLDQSVKVAAAPAFTGLTTNQDSITSSIIGYGHGASASGGGLFRGGFSRGSQSSPSIVSSGDRLGSFGGTGYDGANYIAAGRIDIIVDGTPGTSDMPGRVSILTTPDGSATPSERVRIDSTGLVTVYGAMQVNGNTTLGDASTDTVTCTGRLIVRTAASDPQHATPGSRPAGSVGEIVYYSGKWYGCTNASTPTWEQFTST